MSDLANWQPCPRPQRVVLDGHFTRLEPFDAAIHGKGLFEAATLADADGRFTFLPERPPASLAEFQPWLTAAEASEDPLYFAVIDKRSNTVEGRQTLMRINEANGVIETGHIFWGGRISQTPVTTEAFYLFAKYVFEDLGYRRFEWKCDNANQPSKRAAERFGMSAEGVFRQALVVKGKNRDTAWFSMIDEEWPVMRKAFQAWLAPENFDSDGRQRKKLQEFRGIENE
ncbi:MAG: GNAT family protein [Rhizobiaceae bacterium]